MQTETVPQQTRQNSQEPKKGKLNAHKPIEQAGIKDPDPGPSIPPPGNC